MEEIFRAVNSIGDEIGCYLFWVLIVALCILGRTGETIRLLRKIAGETGTGKDEEG